jgi:hypothetical protein
MAFSFPSLDRIKAMSGQQAQQQLPRLRWIGDFA